MSEKKNIVEFSDDMLQEVTGGAKVNEGLVYDTMPEGYIAVWGGGHCDNFHSRNGNGNSAPFECSNCIHQTGIWLRSKPFKQDACGNSLNYHW